MGFSGAGMRRRVLGAAVAAGAAVPLLPAVAPPAAADVGGVRGCESGDFKLIYEGREAAAGTDYIRFAMQRIMGDGPGGEPCAIHAPLPVHWVADGPDGERVGDWGRYDSEPPEPFTVEPGGRADLVVRQPNPVNYPEEECDPQPVAGVRLYLRFEDDPGTYGSTGGQDVMCAEPGKAVPTAVVTPHGG